MAHGSIVRSARALLFHARAVVVCIALTLGLILWLVAGILGGLFARIGHSINRTIGHWTMRRPEHHRVIRASSVDGAETGHWSLPTWLKA